MTTQSVLTEEEVIAEASTILDAVKATIIAHREVIDKLEQIRMSLQIVVKKSRKKIARRAK